MVELLLNVVWALTAAAAVTWWLRQNTSRSRWSVPVQFCALYCALALLFPAISASDDLHAAQLAVEASDASRKVLKIIAPVRVSASADWLQISSAPLLTLSSALRQDFITIGLVVEPEALASALSFSYTITGRAPPTLPAA